MGIAEKDIKLLWGRAGASCSAPDCRADLSPFLNKSGDVILGEMAHVIGRGKGSARSEPSEEPDDSYKNLILLCPTHHTCIDKAPADYPVGLLRQWKADWEAHVATKLRPIVSAGAGDDFEMRMWSYLNFRQILDVHRHCGLERDATSFLTHLRLAGIVAENGFPLEGNEESFRHTVFDTWPQHIAMSLRDRYATLAEQIISARPPLDVDEFWGIRKLQHLLYPTALVSINRLCTFKTTEKTGTKTRGDREERTVSCFANGIKIAFQIDTWNIYSSSAWTSHFRARKRVSAILMIRSVDSPRDGGPVKLSVTATPLVMGSAFWSPHNRKPDIAYQREAEEEQAMYDADDQ